MSVCRSASECVSLFLSLSLSPYIPVWVCEYVCMCVCVFVCSSCEVYVCSCCHLLILFLVLNNPRTCNLPKLFLHTRRWLHRIQQDQNVDVTDAINALFLVRVFIRVCLSLIFFNIAGGEVPLLYFSLQMLSTFIDNLCMHSCVRVVWCFWDKERERERERERVSVCVCVCVFMYYCWYADGCFQIKVNLLLVFYT